MLQEESRRCNLQIICFYIFNQIGCCINVNSILNGCFTQSLIQYSYILIPTLMRHIRWLISQQSKLFSNDHWLNMFSYDPNTSSFCSYNHRKLIFDWKNENVCLDPFLQSNFIHRSCTKLEFKEILAHFLLVRLLTVLVHISFLLVTSTSVMFVKEN